MPKSVVVAVRDIPRNTNQIIIEKMEIKFEYVKADIVKLKTKTESEIIDSLK